MNWETFKHILVIAHRGDTKRAVENTLPAFESAIRLGVDSLEMDLQLTRDGEVVVFHDDTLKRLAGRPDGVQRMSLEDLRKVRMQGAIIPTLKEVLDLIRDKVLLNLELKSPKFHRALLETKTLQALKAFGLSDSILFSSFHPYSLWHMKRLAPQIACGYLFENRLAVHRRLMGLVHPFSVHAPLAATSKALVEAMHAQGRRFFVWTVNDENDMKTVIDFRVDGIITDEPETLLRLLK